jgi:inorganic pyrophosphatase
MYIIYIMSYNVDMIVEVPYRSNVKYEIDKKLNLMRCDRILNTSMSYPGNYGYIPNTLAGDGDPLDILLISDYQIFPGTIINVKIIGVLLTEDEQGNDEKIIAVPNEQVDPTYSEINNIKDLSKSTLSKIKHFFNHYKDIEKNKWVNVTGFKDKNVALKIYIKSKINN